MTKHRSNRSINLRELKRTGDSANSALMHIYKIHQNYEAHKAYQEKFLPSVTEHTLNMIAACEWMRDQLLLIQNLVVQMATDIDNN